MRTRGIVISSLVAGLCLVLCLSPVTAGCQKCKVKGYVKAHLDRDAEKAMSYLASDFVYRINDCGCTIKRPAYADVLEWQFATNTRIMYDNITLEGDTVTAEFTETGEIYKLLGLNGQRYRMTFRFENDLIAEQTMERLGDGNELLDQAMQPFLEWAGKEHGDLFRKVYRNGRPAYGSETGKAWIGLLQEYRRNGTSG